MKLEVLAIRDAKVEGYMRPFFVPTVGVAIRSFSDECNKPDTELFAHPEDYALFHLGSFEDNTAEFDLHPQPLSVARAMDFKRGV